MTLPLFKNDVLVVRERDDSQKLDPQSERRVARVVLVVDESSERRERLCAVLESYRCTTAATVAEALEALAAGRIDLVVASARTCSTAFLDAIDAKGLSRSCVFLANADELQTMVDAYAALHSFRVVSSELPEDSLRGFVHALLYPRETVRYSVPGAHAELLLPGGARIPCPVLDLSNRGLAVRMLATEELLLPGARIPEVTVLREDEVLVDQVAAIVRYIEILTPGATGELAYKIGLELQRPLPPRDETDAVLTEPARVLAMIQEGLRRGSLTVRAAETGALLSVGRPATLDRALLEIRIDGEVPAEHQAGDVVEGRFELLGASYSFLASIARVERCANTGYSLRAPRALRVIRQRRSVRVRPDSAKPVIVTVWSPFTGVSSGRPAINITASGVAFQIDSQDLLPVGTRIAKLGLGFPDGSKLFCRASVRTLVPDDCPSRFVCGVEFEGLSTTDCTRIADALVHAGRPDLRDGTGTTFEALWSFFLDTGFLYPAKLATMDLPAVRATMTKLLEEPNDVMKASLVVQDEEIQGHLSGILAYRKTWLMQHLAARSSGKPTMTRGRLLNLAVIEYLEQLPHIEWIKLSFRPTNPWPARVFGGFARKLADPALSHLVTHSYMVAPARSPVPSPVHPAIVVREAEPADDARIESYFVASRATVPLRSDDLTSQHLRLGAVSSAYQRIGLERRRIVLVAERHGRFAGFALLEVSSKGLNFSELTNAFRVFMTEEDADARAALIAECRARYAALGFERAIGLSADGDVGAYQALGFDCARQYSCWTWHRSQYQALFEYIMKLRV